MNNHSCSQAFFKSNMQSNTIYHSNLTTVNLSSKHVTTVIIDLHLDVPTELALTTLSLKISNNRL